MVPCEGPVNCSSRTVYTPGEAEPTQEGSGSGHILFSCDGNESSKFSQEEHKPRQTTPTGTPFCPHIGGVG